MFEPAIPACSIAVPPIGPACAFAAIVAKTKAAAEPGNQVIRVMPISCAVRRQLFWEEDASRAITKRVSSAGVDPGLPAKESK
jgi:hypothetical protein